MFIEFYGHKRHSFLKTLSVSHGEADVPPNKLMYMYDPRDVKLT